MVRHFKSIFVVLCILCLSAFGINLLVDNPYSQSLMRNYISDQITKKTNLVVDFKSLNLGVFPLEVDLFAVQVSTNSSKAELPLLEASQLKIRISLSSLLLAKPGLSLVDIDGLKLRWSPDLDLKSLLKKKELHKEEETSWQIQVLSLKNAQIFADLKTPANSNSRALVTGLDLNLKFKDWNKFDGYLSVLSANLNFDGKTYLNETQLGTKINLNHESFLFEDFFIKDKYFILNSNMLKGTISLDHPKFQYMRFNANISSDFDLNFLEKILGIKNTKGQVKSVANLFVSIPFNHPEKTNFFADGDFNISDGYLSDIRLYNSRSHFTTDNTGVRFKDLKLVVGTKEVGIFNGNLDYSSQVKFSFLGQATDFSLATIVSSFGPKFEEVDFNIFAEKLSVEGFGNPFKMRIKALAELSHLDFPTIGIQRKKYNRVPSCYADIDLSFDEQHLDFNTTETLCFIPSVDHVPRPPQDKKLIVPAGALFASRISLREIIHFDDGPNMVLKSSELDLGLGQSFFQLDLNGPAQATARISTSKKVVKTNVKFEVTSALLKRIPLPKTTGELTVFPDSVQWQDLISSDNKSVLLNSQQGFYNFKKDILSFSLSAKNIPSSSIQNILGLFGKEAKIVSFSIKDLVGDFYIPLKDTKQMYSKFDAELGGFSYDGIELVKKMTFSSKQEQQRFTFSSMKMRVGLVDLVGDIQFTKNNFSKFFAYDDYLNVVLSSIETDSSINDFKDFPLVDKALSGLGLNGKFTVQAKVFGPLAKLKGFVNAQIFKVTLSGRPFYPVNIKSFIDHSKMEAFVSQPGDSFLGRMNFDLLGEGVPFKWFFNFKHFDLRPLTHVFGEDPRNYAYITGQWAWDGTLTNWWKSQGYMNLESFNLAYFPFAKVSAAPIYIQNKNQARLNMNAKGWSFENNRNFELFANGIQAELRLQNSNPSKDIGLFVDATLDLGILTRFFPAVQASSGQILAQTSLYGPLNNLKVKTHIFNVQKSPVSVLVPEMSPLFQDIRVNLTYENELFSIQELSARKGKGTIRVSGQYDLSGTSRQTSQINLALDQVAVDFPVPYLKNIQSILSGNLVITGTQKPYQIAGNLKILKAQTEKFLDIEAEIIKEYSAHHVSASFQDDQNPFVRFNIGIEANKSILIQSRTITLKLSSNISLKGTNEKPILRGGMQVDEGRFRYKRDFIISQGELVFDNPVRMDPRLDITAKSQVNTYAVTIFISGTSSKPLVDIIVDPSTRDDGSLISRLDSIVLLSTGRLPQNDSRAVDSRNVVLTTGLNLYAAQLPFDKFNELTGQKYISPYINYTSDDQGTPVPQLNVPIHITDRIEAIVQQIPNKTSALVEVPLHDNISLSGSATSTERSSSAIQEDTQTQSGFDLKFAFPFK